MENYHLEVILSVFLELNRTDFHFKISEKDKFSNKKFFRGIKGSNQSIDSFHELETKYVHYPTVMSLLQFLNFQGDFFVLRELGYLKWIDLTSDNIVVRRFTFNRFQV